VGHGAVGDLALGHVGPQRLHGGAVGGGALVRSASGGVLEQNEPGPPLLENVLVGRGLGGVGVWKCKCVSWREPLEE
jgi:hypothetical protein